MTIEEFKEKIDGKLKESIDKLAIETNDEKTFKTSYEKGMFCLIAASTFRQKADSEIIIELLERILESSNCIDGNTENLDSTIRNN